MKPPKELATRIEELLNEELIALGENPSQLEPAYIAKNMLCEVQDDFSLTYIWKTEPILHIAPETDGPTTKWRMWTK